ncbi:outer membrane porin GjpA [Mycobacterium paraterrae]|uniref:Outer membrane porin GjpA n=1 Tax=Mycobacterium paraterrae TaxID=577492 RepID=A0ABY3VRL5_9MYCO|nr:outer membrane porin GjpA [Mycobacterium paraterrae]UMB72118.1 outer membrane porin GjpA [Mycobacterium paraterrae]
MVLRPYAIAGLTLISGGAVAAVPVLWPVAQVPEVKSMPVELASSDTAIDSFLSAVVAGFNAGEANATQLFDNFALAPFVGAQQGTVDGFGYLQDLINGTSFDTVLGDIQAQLTDVLSSFALVGASSDTISTTTGLTLDTLHSLVFQELPSFLPASDAATLTPVLDFLASPASGILIGALGPVISPEVSLLNSVEAISSAVQAGDTTTAFDDLLAAPVNAIGSIFNGATLDLDPLVPLVNDSGFLPAGDSVSSLSFAFGGLLSGGAVGDTWNVSTGAIHAAGGSLFNSVGMDLNLEFNGIPLTLDLTANPVGPVGALEGFDQAVGLLLGDNWTGKGVTPGDPLAGLTFPTIPVADVSPDAAGSLNLSDLLGDFSGLNDLGGTLSTDLTASLSSLTDLSHELVNGLLSVF